MEMKNKIGWGLVGAGVLIMANEVAKKTTGKNIKDIAINTYEKAELAIANSKIAKASKEYAKAKKK